jgi:hypothetical protein
MAVASCQRAFSCGPAPVSGAADASPCCGLLVSGSGMSVHNRPRCQALDSAAHSGHSVMNRTRSLYTSAVRHHVNGGSTVGGERRQCRLERLSRGAVASWPPRVRGDLPAVGLAHSPGLRRKGPQAGPQRSGSEFLTDRPPGDATRRGATPHSAVVAPVPAIGPLHRAAAGGDAIGAVRAARACQPDFLPYI